MIVFGAALLEGIWLFQWWHVPPGSPESTRIKGSAAKYLLCLIREADQPQSDDTPVLAVEAGTLDSVLLGNLSMH